MLYPTKNDYRRKEAPLVGKGVSMDRGGGRIIVNRNLRSGTNKDSCQSCQCGTHSRGLGRRVAFFAPKDVELVGRGAGLRVADLLRLKFIFINLSADVAEPRYCLTALRAGLTGEKIFSIESEPPARLGWC